MGFDSVISTGQSSGTIPTEEKQIKISNSTVFANNTKPWAVRLPVFRYFSKSSRMLKRQHDPLFMIRTITFPQKPSGLRVFWENI